MSTRDFSSNRTRCYPNTDGKIGNDLITLYTRARDDYSRASFPIKRFGSMFRGISKFFFSFIGRRKKWEEVVSKENESSTRSIEGNEV